MSGVAIVQNVRLEISVDKISFDCSQKYLKVFFVSRTAVMIYRICKTVSDGAIYCNHKALVVDMMIIGRVFQAP